MTLTLTTVDADTVAEYDSVDPADVTVVIPANDAVGVTVSQTTLSVVEGLTGTFTVVLDNAPSGNVKVRVLRVLLRCRCRVSLGITTDLTFTTANWNTAQTVTVTAVDDSTAESAESVTLTLTTVDADTSL